MTSISNNLYIDKLGDIVNKYNNTYKEPLNWSLLMQIQAYIMTLIKKIIGKVLKIKLVIM